MVESIYVRGEGGSIIKMDLPLPEGIQQRFDAGLIVRVHRNGALWDDKPESEPHVETDEEREAREQAEDEARPVGPVKPSRADSKAQWVDYAKLSSDVDHDEIESMTKAQLVERFG
jgi:hypothetical protein